MIEVDDLSVTFGGRRVLDSVSLSVERGEFVALVGRNGAGKTTLLDQLSGLGPTPQGSVRIDGIDVREHPGAARSRVGRVFEDTADQILGSTVTEDVAFGPENLGCSRDEIDRRVDEALRAVELSVDEDRNVETLSGGQRTRVAIAGALAMEPAYLLLDEPTAGLDHPGRQAILAHLRSVHRRDVGIVLATHDLRDLGGDLDRVVGMETGTVVLDCPPARAGEELPGIGVRTPSGWPVH